MQQDIEVTTHTPTATRGHAVIAGVGMAGLLAARVLADHYEHVTALDRNRLPDQPESEAVCHSPPYPCTARPWPDGARNPVSRHQDRIHQDRCCTRRLARRCPTSY